MTGPRRPREFWPQPPTLATPWPTTVLWRWRYELLVGVVLPVSVLHLGPVAVVLTVVLAAMIAIAAAALPGGRRLVVSRFWCIATPHRLRKGMANAWVHDRRGRLPAILWTSPTADGERVLIWCPAGVTAQHLQAAAEVLRGACWAVSLCAAPYGNYAHLAVIDVRRQPATPEALHRDRAVLQLYTGTSDEETAVLRIGRDRRDRISHGPLEDEHVLLTPADHDQLAAALLRIRPVTQYTAVIEWQGTGFDPTVFVGPDLPALRRQLARTLADRGKQLCEDDGQFLRDNPPPVNSGDGAIEAWLAAFREALTVPSWTTYQVRGSAEATATNELP